jgi:predicted small secreted protein
MSRMLLLAMFVAGLALSTISMTGCTNTVRGLGKDFDSDHMQNYNRKTVNEY